MKFDKISQTLLGHYRGAVPFLYSATCLRTLQIVNIHNQYKNIIRTFIRQIILRYRYIAVAIDSDNVRSLYFRHELDCS